VAERAKEKAAAEGGEAAVLADGLLFPGDLQQAQPSFSASATAIGGGGPADAGLAAALGGLSIGGEAAGGEAAAHLKSWAAPGGGGAVQAGSEAPGAATAGGEAGTEAQAAAALRGAAEKGDSDAKG
jgi:hypothetical protein